jgi:hypothetical protein
MRLSTEQLHARRRMLRRRVVCLSERARSGRPELSRLYLAAACRAALAAVRVGRVICERKGGAA